LGVYDRRKYTYRAVSRVFFVGMNGIIVGEYYTVIVNGFLAHRLIVSV